VGIGRIAPRGRPLLATVPILLLAVGCTAGGRSAPGRTLGMDEHDFRIDAAAATIPAGTVTFVVHNDAPATHEFVLVRTDDRADELPLAPDGITVDEDALTSLGELSEVPPGAQQTLTLSLPAGRYVFFCNMEGHYLGGMHGVLEVTADA